MTHRKNQNSILFLTTLGVYLGLLLVGSSSQLRAQASEILRQSVDEKDACASKDELLEQAYKLRSEIGSASNSKSLITKEVASFFDDILDDLRDDPHNLKNGFMAEFVVQRLAPLEIQVSSRIRNSFRYGGADKTKTDFLGERFYSIIEEVSKISCAGSSLNCSDVSLRVAFDEFGFTVETHFSFPQKSATNATLFARAYNLENQYEACSQGDVDRLIFDHTSARSENDQVFIVTRLPRAGLDSLLAK